MFNTLLDYFLARTRNFLDSPAKNWFGTKQQDSKMAHWHFKSLFCMEDVTEIDELERCWRVDCVTVWSWLFPRVQKKMKKRISPKCLFIPLACEVKPSPKDSSVTLASDNVTLLTYEGCITECITPQCLNAVHVTLFSWIFWSQQTAFK